MPTQLDGPALLAAGSQLDDDELPMQMGIQIQSRSRRNREVTKREKIGHCGEASAKSPSLPLALSHLALFIALPLGFVGW